MGRLKNDETLLREALAYFRSMPVFERLLEGFCEKFRSYGEFCGSIRLNIRSEEEREALEGFFARSYRGQKFASVSAVTFRRALQDTRFSVLTPETLLQSFAGGELQGKRAEAESRKLLERRIWQDCISEVQTAVQRPSGERLLKKLWEMSSVEQMIETDENFAALQKQLEKSAFRGESGEDMWRKALRRQLMICIRALALLDRLKSEQRLQYLPAFAAELSGDPHFLDQGTEGERLLQLLLRWNLRSYGMCAQPSFAEERETDGTEEQAETKAAPAMARQELYLSAGLLLDDVSNYAMLCGVRAFCRDGREHGGMAGFAETGEPVNVPLSVIAGWKEILCGPDGLWIVENPVVYAVLAEHWRGRRSLMCMNGQPRLSALLILRLLKKSGTAVHYAGDFDPEGLLIAERVQSCLAEGQLHLWHMSEADYAEARSEKRISEKRLRMLERLRDPQLLRTAEAIRSCGCAGYQENILTAYLEDTVR